MRYLTVIRWAAVGFLLSGVRAQSAPPPEAGEELMKQSENTAQSTVLRDLATGSRPGETVLRAVSGGRVEEDSASGLLLRGSSDPGRRVNVLFLAVDDLKPLLGCYGEAQIRSPNIDRLASMGTVFANAHCQQAVCGPSRASLLTGLRPDQTRVWDLKTKLRKVNPKTVTLPQYFRDNGYESVGIGKIFDPRNVDGRAQGDAPSWSIAYTPSWHYPYSAETGRPTTHYQSAKAHALLKQAEAAGDAEYNAVARLLEDNDAWPAVESEDVPDNAYDDGAMTDRAIEILDRVAGKNKPFFLAVGYKKPHLPFVAPKKYWDLYDREAIALHPFQERAADSPDIAYHNFEELRSYTGIPEEGPIPPEQQKELLHGYYACVSYVDAQIGRLLDALEKSGQKDNTIIVLWGDHGWHLGDHGLWAKHSTFEQATRSPLLFAMPGGKSGNTCAAPVEFVDIFPTLCDLAGLDVPGNLAGRSLKPILTGEVSSVKAFAVSQWPKGKSMGYALRTDRYRYVAWTEKSDKNDIAKDLSRVTATELYDYELDPMETVNQAGNPEYAELVKKLSTQLEAFLAQQ